MPSLAIAEDRSRAVSSWEAYVAARGAFLAAPGTGTGDRALRALGAFCVASEMDAAETRETMHTAMTAILGRVFAG